MDSNQRAYSIFHQKIQLKLFVSFHQVHTIQGYGETELSLMIPLATVFDMSREMVRRLPLKLLLTKRVILNLQALMTPKSLVKDSPEDYAQLMTDF